MAPTERSLQAVKGVLLDLDGTVHVGERVVPGAAEAVRALRRSGLPLRFGTNTTRMSRASLVGRIRRLGVELEAAEVLTAPLAAVAWLESRGLERISLCVPEATLGDFTRFAVDDGSPQAVVIGDLGPGWDFDRLNRAFRHVMAGAEFVALQRNRYWQTGEGLALDAGPFVAALEYATGREATIVGKPSRAFFEAAAESMGIDVGDMVVVGDDVNTDVAGAQAAGAAAVLVRTGKFREGDVSPGSPRPDLVLDSVASLPRALGARCG